MNILDAFTKLSVSIPSNHGKWQCTYLEIDFKAIRVERASITYFDILVIACHVKRFDIALALHLRKVHLVIRAMNYLRQGLANCCETFVFIERVVTKKLFAKIANKNFIII